MFKRKLLLVLSFVLVWGISLSADAGTMVLDSFVDHSPVTIDPAIPKEWMATVNTSTSQGGNDATATAVTIGGSVIAADVAEVCVDYSGIEIACQVNPSSLTNISISLGGNQKGGAAFDYVVTLNPSAAGKTILVTVVSITNTILTDNIPLPQSTALRNIAAGAALPTVTSPTFSGVTTTTATLGGNVTADGGATVTDRGVVWNTTSPAETGGTPVSMGSGLGVFSQLVSGLPAGTLIYFKAYATNSAGTAYSAESSFTTTAVVLPTVTTPTLSGVTDTTATLGGNVTADGGGTVTDRGVVWNTTSPPESGGTPVSMGSGLGVFSQLVSGLPAGTLIYFKAYATNSAGTAYSAESSFTTTAPAVLATVDTPTFSSVAATSAVLGGNVTADGGGTVTDRGVVWNTTSPAETGGTGVSMGSGLGTFSSSVGSLPPGTLIYFKAYATNSAGTAYSSQASFTTLVSLPTVDTPTVTDITATTAILGGTVSSDGGGAVTDRGTVWGTSPNPTGNILSQGSGTGSFSHERTGLPTDTLVYFRAYATNSAGTAYSADGSFTPSSGAIVQASNITFPKVSGRSMRISWTRGTGDGSIVVLRLTATSIVDPADATDYTPNADFTSAEEIPTGNFVVHKGSDNLVLVTGLALNTSYSVAIYEYTGTGGSTAYVLNPAEATQATTNLPVHNEDNRVNCSDCHSHGSWFAQDAELKVVCQTCHTALGEASAKLEFDNHLTPTKNPAVEFVDCGFCHELHSPGGANTTESIHSINGGPAQVNKSFLRANVDKYVTTAATPAYLHTDTPKRVDPHPDAPQAADNPDRAVEGGNDTTARGYCQVCHTLTSNHRSTNTAGSDQAHDGGSGWVSGETHCGACHQHNNNFTPEGGSCVTCHNQEQGGIPRPIITTQFDRLSSHITGGSGVVTQADCLVCHDQTGHPGDQIVGLKDVDDGVTIYNQATPGAPPTSEGEVFAPVCLSCHDDGVASSLPASGSDQTQTSPFTGSGAPPVIDPTAWASAAHNRPVSSFPSTPVTCVGDGANGCHGSGHGSEQLKLLAPAAGPNASPANFCLNCHDADGPSSIDILAQFNAGTDQQYIGGSNYTTVNKRHDVLPADQTFSGATVSCKDCHSPHVNNVTNKVLDPDTDLPLPNYSSTGSYTDDGHSLSYNSGGDSDPTNPEGGGSVIEPDYIQFCLTCHDGTPPPGVVMPSTILDIATAFTVDDQHGNLVGNGSASRGYLKQPWATAADWGSGTQPGSYAALNCTLCHGPHGSGNIYNLRTSITVAGTAMEVGGVDVFTGLSGTTYTLPLNGSSEQEQFGWGAWCTFCHEPSHDTKSGLGCQSGHTHGGGNF